MLEAWRFVAICTVCVVFSAYITATSTRTALYALLNQHARTVLATLDYKTKSVDYKFVKLQQGSDIFIEIYKIDKNNQQELFHRFDLPNSKDAHFESATALSNLFAINLDNDSKKEVVAPVLSEDLVSQLSVIKFNDELNSFEQHIINKL